MEQLEIRELKDIRAKAKGLMFSNKISPVYFRTRWGIHTFFVKQAIDVIVLDSEDRIVAIKKRLLPNRVFMWNPKYENVIELPEGFITKNLKKGIILKYHLVRD